MSMVVQKKSMSSDFGYPVSLDLEFFLCQKRMPILCSRPLRDFYFYFFKNEFCVARVGKSGTVAQFQKVMKKFDIFRAGLL